MRIRQAARRAGVMAEVSLNVPDRVRASLERLRDMSPEDFERLRGALAGLAADVPFPVASPKLAAEVDEVTELDTRALLAFAVQTRALSARIGMPLDELSIALASGIEAGETNLPQRLQELLAADYLAAREKIDTLTRIPEPRLRASRSLTDLRPVFAPGDDVGDIIGYLTITTLVLSLDGDDVDSTVRMLVDRDALEGLKLAVERALKKDEIVRRQMSSNNLMDLNAYGD